MDNFTVVIFIIAILLLLSVFSAKIRFPYPILLLVAGVILGMLPIMPELELEPEIVFLVFLPPLLYDAASNTAWLDFKKEIRPISALAISLVFFTTMSVAVAAHFLIPGFSWPLAFVLGAIVSPPDAVAATSITKGLGLNRKVITIIEGESLVNDASALIAYRYAVSTVISGAFVFWKAGLQFLLIAAGGVLVGVAIGQLLVFAHRKIVDNAIVETSLSLLTPFVAYMVAEYFHASGVLSVVSAGLFISWHSREIFAFQTRLQTKVVWDTVAFVINGLIFMLIGLQMPGIISGFKDYGITKMLAYGILIFLVTIATRIIWVFVGAYHRLIFRWVGAGLTATNDNEDTTSWKNVLVVAWTGTRGVVSLATALALPFTIGAGRAFPQRSQILFFTFIVIFLTIVVQGLSLPLLIRLLRIKRETAAQKKQDKMLDITLAESTLEFINYNFPISLDKKVMDQIRRIHESKYAMLSKKSGELYTDSQLSQFNFVAQMLSAQLEIIKHQRELLLRYQKEGTFNEEAISKAELALDIEELRINNMMKKSEEAS